MVLLYLLYDPESLLSLKKSRLLSLLEEQAATVSNDTASDIDKEFAEFQVCWDPFVDSLSSTCV